MRVRHRSSARPEGRQAVSVWQNSAHFGRPKQIRLQAASPHGAVLHCAVGTYPAHCITVYFHQTRTCSLLCSAVITPRWTATVPAPLLCLTLQRHPLVQNSRCCYVDIWSAERYTTFSPPAILQVTDTGFQKTRTYLITSPRTCYLWSWSQQAHCFNPLKEN